MTLLVSPQISSIYQTKDMDWTTCNESMGLKGLVLGRKTGLEAGPAGPQMGSLFSVTVPQSSEGLSKQIPA
jgi:hypothetical protein